MPTNPPPDISGQPTFWRGKGLLWLSLTLSLLAVAALWIDMSLARYFVTTPVKGDLRKLIQLSEAFAYGGTVAVILLTAAVLDRRGWRILPRLAAAALGAGLVADILKLCIARTRPDHAELAGTATATFLRLFPGEHLHATQSFPSAHTATGVGLACGLAFLYPRGRWLFLVLALSAGTQRMMDQKHFLSDVLAGAAIGALCGWLVTAAWPVSNWFERLELHERHE